MIHQINKLFRLYSHDSSFYLVQAAITLSPPNLIHSDEEESKEKERAGKLILGRRSSFAFSGVALCRQS
jgi:hypothetical protein